MLSFSRLNFNLFISSFASPFPYFKMLKLRQLLNIETVGSGLKYQLAISTIYMTLFLTPAMFILPSTF